MNRRGFLSLLDVATSAAVIPSGLVEELWTPSKAFFLPPAGGWARGNLLLTPELITREALRVLHKNMQFDALVARRYDGSFARMTNAIKVGDTVRIRIPSRMGANA
jgi:hypothetical protein